MLSRFGFGGEPNRYLVIGAGCALLNNAILILGDRCGLHYASSLMLTFALVLPASYLAHASWTFKAPVRWAAFGRFIGGSVSSLAIATCAVGILSGALALPMTIAAPVATIAMTAHNFLMTRWAVKRCSNRRGMTSL